MLVLLLIGLTHMIFIWAGDILSVYAVLGLFLLFFRDFDDKKLLRWALFLIGVWAGRRILQDGILENIAFIKKIAFWGLILGLPFNLLLAVLQYSTLVTGNLKHFLHHFFFIFGVAPLAMAYVALLALMLKSRPTLFNFFIPVGQMALTNYLLQSILIILLFHNVGLGWYAKFGFTVVSGIAIGIFCMQIAFSSIWLKYFRFGPVEWIWRQLTYGKRMMLRKK